MGKSEIIKLSNTDGIIGDMIEEVYEVCFEVGSMTTSRIFPKNDKSEVPKEVIRLATSSDVFISIRDVGMYINIDDYFKINKDSSGYILQILQKYKLCKKREESIDIIVRDNL